ncbi:MAG: TrmO family methyltransferase [Pseudomonadota bacterium]
MGEGQKQEIRRVVTLDLLRVFAVVLLLLAHVGQELRHPLGKFFGIHNFYRVSLGGVAVTIFLILSGVALHLQYGNRRFRFSDFLAKRLLRIYPIYWMSLVVAVAATLLRSWLRNGPLLEPLAKLHAADITLNLTGTYAFVGRWGGPFNGVSWFIGLILSMYLLYPLLAKMFRRHPHLSIVALAVLSVGVRLLVGKYKLLSMRPLDWFPLCRVFEFALGMYLVVLAKKIPWRLLSPPRRVGALIALLGNLTFPFFLVHYPVIFLVKHFHAQGLSKSRSVMLFLGISLALAVLVQLLDTRIPRPRILKWLGVGLRREVTQIGVLRASIPPADSGGALCAVVLDEEHAAALPDIVGAERIWLLVLPDPTRPGPVAMLDVEVVSATPPQVLVRGVDLPDGTPVLGLKPHPPALDADRESRAD